MDQPAPLADSPGDSWVVWRIDDNGNTFIVQEGLSRAAAERLVMEFEARGHKQTYWAERQESPGLAAE